MDGKYPHQSLTFQATLIQAAVIKIAMPFLPVSLRDPDYVLAWMTVSALILRMITNKKIIPYGEKEDVTK